VSQFPVAFSVFVTRAWSAGATFFKTTHPQRQT
jgi:hypothetical protein